MSLQSLGVRWAGLSRAENAMPHAQAGRLRTSTCSSGPPRPPEWPRARHNSLLSRVQASVTSPPFIWLWKWLRMPDAGHPPLSRAARCAQHPAVVCVLSGARGLLSVCNQMIINCRVVSQARPHKSINTHLVPQAGRSSVNPGRMPTAGFRASCVYVTSCVF